MLTKEETVGIKVDFEKLSKIDYIQNVILIYSDLIKMGYKHEQIYLIVDPNQFCDFLITERQISVEKSYTIIWVIVIFICICIQIKKKIFSGEEDELVEVEACIPT